MQNLAVIIPFFNGHQTIGRLLDSLPPSLPVILVDDMSDRAFNPPARSNLTVIGRNVKGYFTGAVNRGIEQCKTDVLILNQDTYFTGDGWLKLLEEKRGEYGLIGEGIQGKHPYWPQGYIHGTFMFIRRDVVEKVGLLNEVDYPLWGSTCEYQLRACRKGFKALPLNAIPDFSHSRKGKFGQAIQTALSREPSKQKLFTDIPPKVSVVTACYNYGRFLPDLVASLIGGPTSLGEMPGQTFQSFEIVIVDDGSTDETEKIGRQLADDWKAIRYIKQKNTGSAAAINTAIKAARGEYIAVIDADDMMESYRLEMLYRLQLKNPHSFIYDDLLLFGNGERRVYGLVRPNRWDSVYPLGFKDATGNAIDYDFEQLLRQNGISKGIMFPKIAWVEAGGYPEIMRYGREDWGFNVALGIKGWCGVKAEKPAYLYRREGHNRTLRNTTPQWRQKFMDQMLALYPDIYRGVRPMGCCGGSSNSGGARVAPLNGGGAMAVNLPGKDGFEILEYIGTNAGDSSWWGPETRTRYTFGGVRRVGYVDKRDVAKMVALVDQGAKVFRVYQKPAELSGITEGLKETAAALQAQTAEVVEVMAEQVAQSLPPFDPADYTVRELNEAIQDLSKSQLAALVEAEENGLNRKSALVTLNEALSV